MSGEFREIRRGRLANRVGALALGLLETMPAARQTAVRRLLWCVRGYLVVADGSTLIDRALRGFPADVRDLCTAAPLRRFDDRSGGGFWPDTNRIWLAAGLETYESQAQVFASARHELFHYVCWNHAHYRRDLGRGFPAMLDALTKAKPIVGGYPKYAAWVRSFLTQGEHANPVEYFADVPTNFQRVEDLPPPIRRYFAALIDGSAPVPSELSEDPPPVDLPLAEFQRLVSP